MNYAEELEARGWTSIAYAGCEAFGRDHVILQRRPDGLWKARHDSDRAGIFTTWHPTPGEALDHLIELMEPVEESLSSARSQVIRLA